jgi:16S rRNA (guanine527-N7)-methyltransferase
MIAEISRASGADVSRETWGRLERYVALLTDESARQNLIAKSTLEHLWSRHILDSAQLLRFDRGGGSWADIGSGAGLPGIVVAILSGRPVTLIEPRRLRAEFLQHCVNELSLPVATVVCAKVERVKGSFDLITARAVAPVDRIFAISEHLSHSETRWVLPKGRSGANELAEAQRSWQGRIWTEPSMTEADAVIVLAEGIRPRGGASR